MPDNETPTGRDPDVESTESYSRTEHPPQRIGPYTILETIGEGGMGIVYLAE